MSTTLIEADLIRMKATNIIAEGTMTLPANSVNDTSVRADAAIDAGKLDHRHRPTYAQPNTAAADETKAIHVAKATGVLNSFQAGSIVKAVGDATCTVDLKKNGVSVLSAVITLNSSNTNRVSVAGTITTSDYVAGDLFEVVIDGTIGTGTLPTGVYCCPEFEEAAA